MKTHHANRLASRRHFLKAALTAGVAPMVIPGGRLFGRVAACRTLNLAMFGCGARTDYMKRLRERSDVKVLAVVDPFENRREEYAAHFNSTYGPGVCRPYSDYREVIGSDQIDVILISTPDHWHVPMCIAGAKNNKHVFVEKPLGVSLSEEIRLRETFRGRDLKFLYGTQQRSSKFGRLAVDLVRNGYIGQVRKVDVWCPVPESKLDIIEPEIPVPKGLDYDLFTGPAEKKPYTKGRCTKLGSYFCHEYSLGFIAGWGAHPLDILQWALNTDHTSPVRYEGSGKTIPDRYVFNTTHSWDIHCEYANGIRVRFMSTDVARPVVEGFHQYWSNNGTAFHGSEGILVYSRGACYLKKGDKYMNVSLVKFRPGDVRLEGVNDHLDDLFAAIRENRATVCGLEAAIRSDTISQLSDIVVRTGKSVEWDPGREAMVNGTAEQLAMLKRSVRKPYEV